MKGINIPMKDNFFNDFITAWHKFNAKTGAGISKAAFARLLIQSGIERCNNAD